MPYKESESNSLYVLCSDGGQKLYQYDTKYVNSIVKELIELDN